MNFLQEKLNTLLADTGTGPKTPELAVAYANRYTNKQYRNMICMLI